MVHSKSVYYLLVDSDRTMPAKPKTVKSPRGTKPEKGKVAAAKATPKQSAAKEEGPRQAKYDAFAQSRENYT